MMTPLKLKNKKGIIEILTIAILLFIMAVGLVIMIFAGKQISSSFGQKLVEVEPTNTSFNAFNSTITKATNVGDFFFMSLFAMLIISIIITSFLFFSHPIFAGIYMILAIVSLIVSVVLSNSYETISQIPVFNSSVSSMPMMNYVLLHMPLFILGVIVISGIIIYAKLRSGGADSMAGM